MLILMGNYGDITKADSYEEFDRIMEEFKPALTLVPSIIMPGE